MTVAALPTFSLADAQERWNVSKWLATDIVAGFIAMGLVEVVNTDTFAVTTTGVEWSEGITSIAAEFLEVEA